MMKHEMGTRMKRLNTAMILADWVRIACYMAGIAGCWVPLQTVSALPPELAGYDPSQQVRFNTVAQADAKRRELIAYIWPDGLPVNALPAVTPMIGREVFAGDLGGLDGALAAAVERLDADVAPYEFHGIRSHLISPVVLNQVIMPCLLGTVDLSIKQAAPPPMVPALFATESHVVRFDAAGNKTWESASGMSRDVWMLPNGNALFPCNFKPGVEGGVREVAPDGKVVWEFKTGGWVLSCQRMGDGNTLVGAAGQCALLIVDPAGKVIKEIKVALRKSNIHSLTMARQLANGHFLVVEEELCMVREYLPDGRVAWEVKPPFRPFAAVRVKNGNTFISGQDGIVEVTPDKTVVWQVTREDVKDMGPRWFAGIQIRANGNIVVCNAGGKVPFYELNRDKKVVWQSTLPAGQPGLGHGIFLLEEKPPFLR